MFNFDKELSNIPGTQTEIQKNIVKLSHVNVQMRRNAVNALFPPNISDLANQTAIAEAGAIAPLVHALNDTDTEVKEMSAVVLCGLAINNSMNQTMIIEAGGIAPLIRLLNDANIKVKKMASMALKSIITNNTPAIQSRIVTASDIEPLAHLLSDTDTAMKQTVTEILFYLTFNNPANQPAIIEAGIVMPLVLLLKDTDTKVRQTVAGVLNNLTARNDPVNQKAVAAAGGIAPLIHLLNDADIAVKIRAAAALGGLANGNLENQAAIAIKSGIAPLIHLLKDADTQVRARAAGALLCLAAGYSANQMAIAAAGGIVLLLALLKDVDTEVKQHAVGALSCLATDNPANQRAVVAAGGIALLTSSLRDPDAMVRQLTTGMLCRLALNNPTNQTLIKNAGALPILEQLSRTDDNVTTKELAKGVLLTFQLTEAQALKQEQAAPPPIKKQQGNFICQQRVSSAASTPAQTYQDPFSLLNSSAMDAAWNTTSTKATTERASNFATFQPSVSNPFSEFDNIFSASVSSKVTSKASADWTSDFATVTPPLPPAKAIIPSLADMRIASNLTTIPWHALVIQRELGRGGFGVVSEALWQGTRVAIKQLIGQLTAELLNEFRSETEVHARLRHTNIIALYGVCVEPLKYALVMEFMASGSLFDVLKNPTELPWSLRLSLSLDMVSGLLYLHTQHIIHRDLKSLNILVDDHMRAKIADFGLAKIKLSTASMTKGGGGTPHWMAPELFDETINSPATDVYATGIILWEIAARKLPYEGKNPSQIMRFVEKGNRETMPAGTPPPFRVLINRCWAQRAEDRPSIEVVARDIREIQVRLPSNASSAKATVDSGYAAFSRR